MRRANFIKRFDLETKNFGENFITEINENKIKKITRPNLSEDFDVNSAYDAFVELSKSNIIDNIITESYK